MTFQLGEQQAYIFPARAHHSSHVLFLMDDIPVVADLFGKMIQWPVSPAPSLYWILDSLGAIKAELFNVIALHCYS